jgi:DEAD/DEAH box helicase domain-containing protein
LSPLEFIQDLRSDHDSAERLVHVETLPAREGSYLEPDQPLHPLLQAHAEKAGIRKLYRHQALTLNAVRAGKHATVVTPTASGKTLSYLLPILSRLLEEPDAKSLLLFPIKALAQDQLGIIQSWLKPLEEAGKPFRAGIYDGDTTPYRRGKMRTEPPSVLLSNPDMLNLGILPHHTGWGNFFAKLRYVVVDEAHSYRGIFGAHAAMIFRRLRRLARAYGSDPQFIFLSATIANPAEFTGRLLGAETTVIAENGAPAAPKHFALWNPQASPYSESTSLFSRSLRAGFKTIAFTKARKITELMSLWTKQQWPDLASRVKSYRAGYLPEERREIERQLFGGQLEGVLTTSALESGIDVGGLDACLLVGYPGTMISTYQRAGRVGREGRDSLVILVALADAMDQYFMRHPQFFFSKPTEHALVPLDNRVIAAKHLAAAAEEMPLSTEDKPFYGEDLDQRLEKLWKDGVLRKSDQGLFHSGQRQAARQIQIRSSGDSYLIEAAIPGSAPKLIGRIDVPRVFRDCHPGAIYLHAGVQYRVAELDQSLKKVVVEEVEADYFTEPRSSDETEILQVLKRRDWGHISWCFGDVMAREQVRGYVTKHISTQKVLAEFEQELPAHSYQTQAAWWLLPSEWRMEFSKLGHDFLGSIHALEHAQIALLPLQVLCDRWDLGGVSMASHPQLDQPAIFIFDGHAGGAALAEKGWDLVEEWLNNVEALLKDCPCEEGCPACIQSPKCGNGNKPLDKAGAAELVRRLKATVGKKEDVGSKERTSEAGGRGQEAEKETPRMDKIMEPPANQSVNRTLSTGYRELPAKPKLDPRSANIVFFDLETQYLADEVGGWGNLHAMKISVAASFSTKTMQFKQYVEGTANQLAEELAAADLVVGFNSKGFDYGVLQPYTKHALRSLPSLDMLEEVTRTLGHRLKLDTLGKATLNAAKSGDGLQAVQWYREGKVGQLLEYCQQDVALTRDLWEFGRKYGYLLYEDRQGKLMRVAVDW